MSKTYNDIKNALNKAFIDYNLDSVESLCPSFLYNNKEENKKIISTLKEEFKKCEEFYISVAFITYSGLQILKETLKEINDKGIKGKILTSDYLCFTEPKALKFLQDNFNNIEVKMYKSSDLDGFHTKGYFFKQKDDIYKIIIGSSNITAKALTINQEWNTELISTKDGKLIKELFDQFNLLWNKSTNLKDYINTYTKIYDEANKEKVILSVDNLINQKIEPNSMQIEFSQKFKQLNEQGGKRGLLISSTGTGKTYASAFALKNVDAKKVLFLAHRTTLLIQAISAYQRIFPNSSFSILTGDKTYIKNLNDISYFDNNEYDFVFSTCEMMSKKIDDFIEVTKFDYIVIDEVHRAGSNTYQKILNYFKPKFILGMTATPERTNDESLIFNLFDHNVIFEIRLEDALDYGLLCPFHYYGITDLKGINDETYDKQDFNKLFSNERVEYIIKQSNFYEYSGDRLRGLIFVSRKEEGRRLEILLNQKNYKTKFLDGSFSSSEREKYFRLLEETNKNNEYLDFIISVDILNEGVDIPEVNQIIMLRPTQSSIIFIQQLGRGLRKWKNKDFVTIIDFIGNYDSNYMIAKAFSGSGNKEQARLVVTSSFIPGVSTIEFDEIAQKKIFESIKKTNFDTMSNFKIEYTHLKNRLNRIPNLTDFYEFTYFDPYRIIEKFKSYQDFLLKIEKDLNYSQKELEYYRFISKIISSGLRLDEVNALEYLIKNKNLTKYFDEKLISLNKKLTIINEFNGSFYGKNNDSLSLINNSLNISEDFEEILKNSSFLDNINNLILMSKLRNNKFYGKKYKKSDLCLNSLYSREDVSIIFNCKVNRASTIYGYQYLKEENVFPIFINYIKTPEISDATRYEDMFINRQKFQWNSRHGEYIESKNMQTLINSKNNNTKIYLFVRKSIDENSGSNKHYFLGEMSIIDFKEIMRNNFKYVLFNFALSDEVRSDLYEYFKKDINN